MLFICYIDSSAVVVLIDTWWNVNTAIVSTWTPPLLVLIDTWWNVNQVPAAVLYFQLQF